MRMKIHFTGRGIKRFKTVVNSSPKNNKKQQAFFRKKGKGGFNPQQLSFQGKADTIHSSKTDSKEEVHEGGNVETRIAFKEFGDSLFGYGIESVLE